jgi:hypothetical protein
VLRALGLVLLASSAALGEPLQRDEVPEPLRPWVDWVLRGHESETCPLLQAAGTRACVWPGRLSLDLGASGGSFEQSVFVATDSDVALPGGDGGAWPEDVRADGAPISVVAGSELPTVRLARGSHVLSGRFVWSASPPGLRVPLQTGIVDLTLNGERVARPRRDAAGTLWLRDGSAAPAAGPAENRVDVEVHRLLVDAVPPQLTTVITLRASGEAREERLGVALPAAMAPTGLDSPLPARLDADGRLRVQVRPGEWTLRIRSRLSERADAFGPAKQPSGARWDGAEIWAVALAPELRLVDVEGAPAIDPTQTEMPAEWRSLPAYRLDPEAKIRFVEKRRGSEGGAADQLKLVRSWHLDFDGGGATVVDSVTGTLRSSLRLEMGERTALGRAAIAGQDQPITQRAGSERLGIETALGALALEADSRVEGGVTRLPAVGWDHDFDALSASLMIPPGYRLLHATGVDEASDTWVSRWDLLSIFFVLLIGVAVWRLFGAQPAALAIAALALSWNELGAPQLTWLALAVLEALRRVAPAGRLARGVRLAYLAALVVLAVIAVPFAIRQVRVGLFPALERPHLEIPGIATEPSAPAEQELAADATAIVEEGALAKPRLQPRTRDVPASVSSREGLDYAYSKSTFEPDPAATVPTGPGRPEWTWERVALAWSGPVTRDQELGLWLIPPWANALLAILRVLLLVVLAREFALAWRRRETGGDSGDTPAPARDAPAAAGSAALLLAGVLFAPNAARADLPTPELLESLRAQLLEAPACAPQCATLTRLALGVAGERLELRLAVDAAAETGVPLPGGGTSEGAFVPNAVVVDGQPASALLRGDGGALWLRLAAGRHEVQLSGPLPPRATVELPLPLAPRRVSLAPLAGWAVVGIRPDGSAAGALQLVREARAARTDAKLEATEIPPFVRVTRALELGLSWRVRTSVARVAPEQGPIVASVPLLAGESVTTPGIRVERGRALVTIPAGESVLAYESSLAIAERVELAAPARVPWTEVWQVAAGPLWHVEASGLPPVDALREGERSREWRPWPGEKLALAIERPAGHAGATLTIDRSTLTLAPGRRATDATLTLALRSSQGGQHAVTLPEGAQLTSLRVNGEPQPLRQEERRVPLTLAPGSREVELGWREPRGMRAFFRSSAQDAGAPSVNANVELEVPQNRWVLFAGGPRLGPSVMFWSTLAIVAGAAFLLGRFTFTPLRTRDWLLLGVGLTQAPLAAAAPVVALLLLLGLRGRHAARFAALRPLAFGFLQLALVGLAGVAAACLAYAIQQGLLGTPEMRIAGNGSSSFTLRWYLDRSAPELPAPWVISLSIWWYRAAMLAWSMWLALALVQWARWAFAQWSVGGMLRPQRA